MHAAVMGQIIGISGRLESTLGVLLALMSRGSAPITISMFHAVVSTDAQKAMLLATAQHALAGVELEAFKDLLEDFRPRYTERSKLVHNLWGHSNDHPDKALWWRTADLGATIAKISAATTLAAAGQIAVDEDISLKAMLYTVRDLEGIAARFGEYTERVNTFTTQLIQAHPTLASATTAATNAPPMGDQSQLDLHQRPQTAPSGDQPAPQPDQS